MPPAEAAVAGVTRALAMRRRDEAVVVGATHAARNQPLAGTIASVALSLVSASVLSVLFTMRANAIRAWRRLPYVVWLLFFIYTDSYVFVVASTLVQYGIDINTSLAVCDAAILICLVFYVTTKIAIYLFLVEKAHIIRSTTKRRMQSKLYIFNSIGMMGIYVVVVTLNFVFRTKRIDDGTCFIGMEKIAMIPLISFDALVNAYLTIIFLIPLITTLYRPPKVRERADNFAPIGLSSFRKLSRTPTKRLRTIAIRTFIGALSTLASSIVNLTVLMVLNGEPGWVCLMCCNSDVLFAAVVLYWITSRDNAASTCCSREKEQKSPTNQFGGAAAAAAGAAAAEASGSCWSTVGDPRPDYATGSRSNAWRLPGVESTPSLRRDSTCSLAVIAAASSRGKTLDEEINGGKTTTAGPPTPKTVTIRGHQPAPVPDRRLPQAMLLEQLRGADSSEADCRSPGSSTFGQAKFDDGETDERIRSSTSRPPGDTSRGGGGGEAGATTVDGPTGARPTTPRKTSDHPGGKG